MKNQVLVLGLSLGYFSFHSFFPILAQVASDCPQDVETLTAKLLQDLPDYANRVLQRNTTQTLDFSTYVIVAGKAEFEPLEDLPKTDFVTQVFFTTLERKYSYQRIVNRQNYHWLFLTQTPKGWQLVMLYTRFGSASDTIPASPPRNTTEGVMGQAVSLWLRDCNAEAL